MGSVEAPTDACDRCKPVTLVYFRFTWKTEVVDRQKMLQVPYRLSTLAVCNHMDFLPLVPSTRNALREAVYLTELLLHLAEVARLVTCLLSVLCIEMSVSIYFPSKVCAIVNNSTLLFEWHYPNKLLV